VTEREDPFDRVVEALKEPVRISPSLTARVMSEIERLPPDAAEPAATGRPLAWFRRPWTIRLSPLGGLAVAAGLAAAVITGGRLVARRGEADARAARVAPASTRPIQFVLVAPRALSVTVVGDFNDWNVSATPLAHSNGEDVWWVTVPLSAGRYRYSFVVDGTLWLRDPEAPAADDEFGRSNSVVTVGGGP